MSALSLLTNAFRDTWPGALDLLWSRTCCACGAGMGEGPESGLCWDCRRAAIRIERPYCETCGAAVAGRVDHAFVCSDCREQAPSFDGARSLFRSEGPVRMAIHDLKYHGNFAVVPDLARLLVAGWAVEFGGAPVDALVPVPLHPQRFRQRGFNQSQLLVTAMARLEPGLRVRNLLRRVRPTETQTHLTRAQRLENVRGVFAVRKGPLPSAVLLVDDVMTTGATVDACARALKRAGVEKVLALSVARG